DDAMPPAAARFHLPPLPSTNCWNPRTLPVSGCTSLSTEGKVQYSIIRGYSSATKQDVELRNAPITARDLCHPDAAVPGHRVLYSLAPMRANRAGTESEI